METEETSSAFRRYFRWVVLGAIIAWGIWLLAPSGDSPETVSSKPGEVVEQTDSRFVLRLSIGQFYIPGNIPDGVGDPLHGLQDVVDDFERHFPDTRVELISTPTLREYLVPQLMSGQAPDILNVNVEDVWVDIHKGWYLALDPYLEQPNQFVRAKGDPSLPGYEQWWDMFRYQAISRGKAAPDGRMYCITYDMIETGLFYNKRIFREVGLELPQTWEEFTSSLATLRENGYTPLLMSLDMFNDWGVDLVFDQLYFSLLPGIDLRQDPLREPYLEGYLDWDELCFLKTKGFFTSGDPRYRALWQLLRDLRQYCSPSISTVDVVREFVNQRGAIIWVPSMFTYRLSADRSLGFDWGVFYLPPFTTETTPYASNTPMCVIGGAGTQLEVSNSAYGDTGDPATSERLKRVIALLQFLTLPENYEQIVNEYPCFLPNIIGVPVLEPLKPFEEILERRYTTTKWIYTFDLRFTEVQRRMLELYLNDGIGLDAFIDWQDKNITSSCGAMVSRLSSDMEVLERAWQEKAPLRAGMGRLLDAD